MRSFITLEFEKETKENIKKVQNIIRAKSIEGRFKYIDNFHLTLKFLGEVDSITIENIYTKLCIELKSFESFKLIIGGVGAFGLGDVIRTIYLDTKGETNKLFNLVKAVEGACQSCGFKKEKAYAPHITIAQDVRLNIPFQKLKQEIDEIYNEIICFDKVIIMKSEQIQGKRIYTPIKTIKLK